MLTFSKMHGIGNDYIYINCFQETVTDPEKLSIFMSNVRFAVDNINRRFWLTFYDRVTKKPLSKISLDNAYKKVSAKTKKKNDKLREKKTNFKKENDPLDLDM